MHLFEKRERGSYRGLILTVALFAALVFLFSFALGSVEQQGAAEQVKLLEDALQRAMVSCYAIEGRYPPSLAYLQEYYGVVVDESRYIVRYDAFAENVMPTLRVLVKGAQSL